MAKFSDWKGRSHRGVRPCNRLGYSSRPVGGFLGQASVPWKPRRIHYDLQKPGLRQRRVGSTVLIPFQQETWIDPSMCFVPMCNHKGYDHACYQNPGLLSWQFRGSLCVSTHQAIHCQMGKRGTRGAGLLALGRREQGPRPGALYSYYSSGRLSCGWESSGQGGSCEASCPKGSQKGSQVQGCGWRGRSSRTSKKVGACSRSRDFRLGWERRWGNPRAASFERSGLGGVVRARRFRLCSRSDSEGGSLGEGSESESSQEEAEGEKRTSRTVSSVGEASKSCKSPRWGPAAVGPSTGGPGSGYKHWYFSQFAEATGTAGQFDSRGEVGATERVEEEEREEGPSEAACSSSCPGIRRKGQREEKQEGSQRAKDQVREEGEAIFEKDGEEGEEEARISGGFISSGVEQFISDRELGRWLAERLGGGSIQQRRLQVDGTFEEEVEGEARICSEVTHSSCSSSTGSVLKGSNWEPGGSLVDRRSEDGQLLLDCGETPDGNSYGPHQGTASFGSGNRPSSTRRSGRAGRRVGWKIHVHSPGKFGRQLEHSEALGAASLRRRDSRNTRDRAGSSSTCQDGGQGGSGRPMAMELQFKRSRRWSRKRTFLERCQSRRKRKREERPKGKRKVQGLELSSRRKRRRLQDQGQGSREVIVDGGLHAESLANAELDSEDSLAMLTTSGVCHFTDVIACCRSYRETGCAVAWWLIAGGTSERVDALSINLISHYFSISAKSTASRSRPRGAVFPLREGELHELVEIFTRCALTDVVVEQFVNTWACKAWAYVSMCALNRLAGVGVRPPCERWSHAERNAFLSLEGAARRLSSRDVQHDPQTEDAWQKELAQRRIGYSGEEISTCHTLTWEQVEPALPSAIHGGSIQAVDWVGVRTRDFLLNPQKLLKPHEEVTLPRMPGRVHIDPNDKVKIAQELVSRKVCAWLPLDKVYKVNGVHVLNGLFGVEKPALTASGKPVLRLIMNLVGSNATQFQLVGGCNSLPNITSWQSVVLDGKEEIEIFQSDMSNAFYLFAIPPCWWGHLAFNALADGAEAGGSPGQTYALCCAVIPMGWLNSVGIMQEMAERLLLTQKVPKNQQLSRDRTLPMWMNDILSTAVSEERSWWHVYLDNYAGGERLTPENRSLAARECHELAETAWGRAGVVASEKKRVCAAKRATELGAEIDGELGCLGVPVAKILKLVVSTMWLVKQPYLDKKLCQIIAGRWVFVMQFRRPSMSFLRWTWKYISGKERSTESLRWKVRCEFLDLIMCSSTMHSYLGAEVSSKVVCTDASEIGGSVELSEELTAEGVDVLSASRKLDMERNGTIPVLVVSLFNGIGGCFRAYDVIGLSPEGRVSVELDAGANRITSRRWPSAEQYKDVRGITRETVAGWSRKYLGVIEVHLWAGWPCVDLSRVKHGRQNLAGQHSSLIFEVLRIHKLLEDEFGPLVKIKFVYENVSSMDRSAAEEITSMVGSIPYELDSSDAVPMRRPRFAWTSETLEALMPGVFVEPRSYWKRVHAPANYPETKDWITPGYEWEGERTGAIFPTCMKCIPRQRPPPRPAGLDKSSELAKRRWTEDSFRYPPYQYNERYVITTPSTWRLLSAEEKELLLGYGYQHTKLAWPTSKIKQNPNGFSDARHSYLGDSFSVYSFVILAAACCRDFLPTLDYQHLAKRMGMAPGFRAHLRSWAPLCRRLSYGSSVVPPEYFAMGMELFNRWLLRKTNHTGSDIRMVTGEVCNPKAYPRQSLCSAWWSWKNVFTKRWARKAHINVLELETILLGVKFQITRLDAWDQRIFQLTDSYVCVKALLQRVALQVCN